MPTSLGPSGQLHTAGAWGPSHGTQSSTNFSNMSLSHGLQFFTNYSSVGLFHGVQTFRNRLLQRGSPTGSQVLPANMLWRGLLSPRIHSSCQELAPAQASHGVKASFRCLHLLHCRILHRLQVESLHPIIFPPWAVGRQPASPWSSARAAGESLCRHLEHLLPLLLHNPWCLKSFSHLLPPLSGCKSSL